MIAFLLQHHITPAIFIILSLLSVTMIIFVIGAIRVDTVAITVLVVLGASRLLPTNQLFSGFANEAVVALIAVMIIGKGLENAGISIITADFLLKLSRNNTGQILINRLLIILMLLAGLLSSMLRSVGTIAILLPIITKICARLGLSRSTLLMPVGFASVLGGTLTMIGSAPLILLNSLLAGAYNYYAVFNQANNKSHLFRPFKLFATAPIGIMLMAAGIAYVFFLKNKLGFFKETIGPPSKQQYKSSYFQKTYNKGGGIFELKLRADSSLVNYTINDLESKFKDQISILAVRSEKQICFPPLRNTILRPNCTIALTGDKNFITELAQRYNLKLAQQLNVFADLLHYTNADLIEAIIPPSSLLIGQKVSELHMKRNYNIHVLSLYRNNKVYLGAELNTLSLRAGDALALFAGWEYIHALQQKPDFLVLTNELIPYQTINEHKRPWALFFFILAFIAIVFNLMPAALGFLMGACGMILTGVLTMDQAYESISWKTVFLLAGIMPLGLATQTTGTAEWITELILHKHSQLSVFKVLMWLGFGSTILALLLSNIGAMVLLTPIAIDLAMQLNSDPRLFALTVALCASNTFILPANQVNSLIAGPGKYEASSFYKLGSGLTIIYWLTVAFGLWLCFNWQI